MRPFPQADCHDAPWLVGDAGQAAQARLNDDILPDMGRMTGRWP
jgi:hypothetical protein